MSPELSDALALIVDAPFSNVDVPLAVQLLILAELRAIRQELIKANDLTNLLFRPGPL